MDIALYPKYIIRNLFARGRSGFFDAGYKLLYPECSRRGMTPWQHYVLEGKRKGFGNGSHPSDEVFFREGYELEYPDVKAAGVDSWHHYAEKGFAEGRDNGHHPPAELFFAAGYLEMYPDVKQAGTDPWKHYVLKGKDAGYDNGNHPSPRQFFAEGYLEMYPDVRNSGMDPWHHYVLEGKQAGRDNGLHPQEKEFFPEGYLEMYPDAAKSGLDPWHHYVLKGKKEGRDNGHHPKPVQFFAEGYLEMYPEVRNSGLDPWHHYVLEGKKAGRDGGLHPEEKAFFAGGYLEMYPDAAKSGMDPWHHYVLIGKKEGRDNGHHPKDVMFFPEGYKLNYPCCADEPYGSDPWMNYIKVGKAARRNDGLLPDGPFFYGGFLERHPGCSEAAAWKDYVLNILKNPDRDMYLYPERSFVRESLRAGNPSVAVIMPLHDGRDKAIEAIQSVLKQSWLNWHLYAVIGCSDDGPREYLESAISDPRITILKSEEKGSSGARNTAIANIKDEDFVAYLDSDHTWSREYLELMLCRFLETHACCCYCAEKRFRRAEDGTETVLEFVYPSFDIRRLMESDCIDLNVLMHRAGVFSEGLAFDTALGRLAGWDFVLTLAQRHSFSSLPYVGCSFEVEEEAEAGKPAAQNTVVSQRCADAVRSKHLIDWEFLSEDAERLDGSLVSVIVYCRGNDSPEFLRNCLISLRNARTYGHSEYRTEIILVDDSCSEGRHKTVAWLHSQSLIDRYFFTRTASAFALGCNMALSMARGRFAVFLDSYSYVSINWLDPLIDPLRRHPWLMGTAAKVMQPDGVINSAGCLFDSVSGLPYDLLRDMPPEFPAAKRITLLPGVNSYCSAFRTHDLIARKGLCCLYASWLAITDLCLQLVGGRPCFAFIPSSAVICPADARQLPDVKTADLETFTERWYGKEIYNGLKYFARRNLEEYLNHGEKVCPISFKQYTATASADCSAGSTVPVYDFHKLGYSLVIGRDLLFLISRMKSFTPRIVIKDPATGKPFYKKYEWGDYYFARALAAAFARLGFDSRIDSREDWYSHDDGVCINIVLRGCVKFECGRAPGSFNIMWLISHPDMIDVGELNEYDFVFAASEILSGKYRSSESVRVPCAYLPQCTSPEIFYPAPESAAYSAGNLLLGNSRGMLRNSVKKCLDEGVDIQIIGNGWDKLVKHELVRSAAVPSLLVPSLYRSADAVLNDHWEDMRQNGIVSNRIYDVLACGRGIVTDNFRNIPEELKFACFSYENCSIREAIGKCREFNKSITDQQKLKLHELISDNHSFARRVLQIIEAVYPILEQKWKVRL